MSGMVRRDVIKAANERAQANAPRDDLAARIVHRLTCTRCAQGWSCGGLGEGDYAAAGEIAGLLAEVRAEERERVAQAIEAQRVEWVTDWEPSVGRAMVDVSMRKAASIARQAVRDAD